mmetsp:Transcript_32000/g.51012  ORF Transcript_32000/g.51012 Transcript_32000/m.51012 type:complete len:121 (-) Transcript_32000:68-430(-)
MILLIAVFRHEVVDRRARHYPTSKRQQQQPCLPSKQTKDPTTLTNNLPSSSHRSCNCKHPTTFAQTTIILDTKYYPTSYASNDIHTPQSYKTQTTTQLAIQQQSYTTANNNHTKHKLLPN